MSVDVLAVMGKAAALLRDMHPRDESPTGNELMEARATVEAMAEALLVAQSRFSNQNGEVSMKVWNDNYDAVREIEIALRRYRGEQP